VVSPELICIPSSNARFAAQAQAVLDELLREEPAHCDAEEFQRRLRSFFPGSVVRERHPLAELVLEGAPVWYVTDRAFRSRIDLTIELDVPQQTVFDVYVRDVVEWQTALRLSPLRIVPGLVGSEWTASWQIVGITLHGSLRLVEADPPHFVRFEAGGGGVRAWYDTSFATTSAGRTRILVAGDYDLPAGLLGRIADRIVVESIIRRQIDGAHAELVELATTKHGARAARPTGSMGPPGRTGPNEPTGSSGSSGSTGSLSNVP
jgi:hypothetical protein